ncbi:hypothetical protein T4A_4739 [Trichinella pseudospiralis]|uniref:Uncharacterized protein n=1 Tax=Trichinella pseudospiralis TaxID=6337 RepID=A0A0V1EBI3_TRIPS|nr:hypothetical protein T4A_4739 [Trichinella pseudospiralis]
MKAEVWTRSDMSGLVDQSGLSVWNSGNGAAVNQPPIRSATFPFTLILLSFLTLALISPNLVKSSSLLLYCET